jgi:hypothetical protein
MSESISPAEFRAERRKLERKYQIAIGKKWRRRSYTRKKIEDQISYFKQKRIEKKKLNPLDFLKLKSLELRRIRDQTIPLAMTKTWKRYKISESNYVWLIKLYDFLPLREMLTTGEMVVLGSAELILFSAKIPLVILKISGESIVDVVDYFVRKK